jgi:hypothetical protein
MTSPEELSFEAERLKGEVKQLRSLANQQAEKIGGLSAQVTAADRLAKTLERDLARERHNAEVEIGAIKRQVHDLKSEAHGEPMLREAAEARLRRVADGVAECEGDGGCRATKTLADSDDDDEGIECPLVDCCQSEPCKKPKTVEKLLAQIEPERLTRRKASTGMMLAKLHSETVTVIDETNANELDAAHKRYELFAGAVYWEADRQLREGPDLSKLQDILREHGGSRVPPSPCAKQAAWRDL